MASNTIDDLFPSALATKARALDFAGTQTILVRVVLQAILTAIVTGLLTVTVAMGASTSQDIQWVAEQLRANGFTVSFSTTNMVITWSL